MYTSWRYAGVISSRSPRRFFGRSFWRGQDPYDAKGTLLLAQYGEGRAECPSKVRHLSDGEEPFTTTGFIYSITRSYTTMGRCEYGFYFGSILDSVRQRLYICGGRSVFEDGPFYPVQQD